MSEAIDRDDSPPRPGPEMEIKRLRANQSLSVTLLSALWGVWTHWNGRCSEPCYKDHKKCAGHRKGYPRRWKGYIHAIDHASREEIFVELTPLACQCLLRQLGSATRLRGQVVRIKRLGGDRARLEVFVMPPHPEHLQLPKEKDPYPILAKLWGIADGEALFGGSDDIPENE